MHSRYFKLQMLLKTQFFIFGLDNTGLALLSRNFRPT